MQVSISRFCLATLVAFTIGSPALAAPLVASRTTANIGGSGFDAIDFFYESTAGAEFTNYYLDFGTANGALIYDPLPAAKQDVGSDAIDTFMNTIGSYAGVGDATHLQSTYRPGGGSDAPAFIDRIEWDVFDLLTGDTNDFEGNAGSYHMARILVQPDARWHATFHAYDTASVGIGAGYNFTNDPGWTFPQPVVPPPPVNPVPQPPTVPDPPGPPPVDPGPVTPPFIITPAIVVPPPTPPPPTPQPVVSSSTILNVGGSGLNAIDFYYSNSPGAEFTNYNLNFRTDDASIYDPMPGLRQDAGGDAVDTFMNTVGSLLDLGNAVHLHGTYDPLAASGADPISKIEWDVFDTMPGDTNNMDGAGEAPYHLARILVGPDATWNATFTAFDTNSPGIPSAHNFTNNPSGFTPEFVPVPVVPEPVLPDPVVPDPVDPVLPVQPPPDVTDPPSDDGPGQVEPRPGIEVPTDGDPVTFPAEFPSLVEIPFRGWIEVVPLPHEGRLQIWPTDWLIVVDGVAEAPMFADDSFLIPTSTHFFDRAILQELSDSLFTTVSTNVTTTGTNLSAWRFSLNGQQYVAVDFGVPEPTTALLATLALASLAAANGRRRRQS